MPISELKVPPLPTNQNFSDFEKEALGEMVLKTMKKALRTVVKQVRDLIDAEMIPDQVQD